MNANRAWASCLIACGILVGGSTGFAVDDPQFIRGPGTTTPVDPTQPDWIEVHR